MVVHDTIHHDLNQVTFTKRLIQRLKAACMWALSTISLDSPNPVLFGNHWRLEIIATAARNSSIIHHLLHECCFTLWMDGRWAACRGEREPSSTWWMSGQFYKKVKMVGSPTYYHNHTIRNQTVVLLIAPRKQNNSKNSYTQYCYCVLIDLVYIAGRSWGWYTNLVWPLLCGASWYL